MNAPDNIFETERATHRLPLEAARDPSRKVQQPTHGRLVTLAGFSTTIPSHPVSEHLARALVAETGASILTIRLTPEEAPASLGDWHRLAPHINGEFCFAGLAEHSPSAGDCLTLRVLDDAGSAAMFATLLDHCAEHYELVLLDAPAVLFRPVMAGCVAKSNISFALLRPRAEDFVDYSRLVAALRSEGSSAERFPKPVLVLEESEPAHGFRELLHQNLGADAEKEPAFVPAGLAGDLRYLRCGKVSFTGHIRSLAREIVGRRLGLALSSGGARGLSHIGVIQVLEENGIEVDAVAGCSMGAYVGAIWAHGRNGTELEVLAREVESRWGLFKLIDPVLPPRRGFILGNSIVNRLRRSIGDAHFSDLVHPLRIVATNLNTLERVVFASGEVAPAVHASIAIPGVCVPVGIGRELYVDGGITDPLPVDVLKDMGVDRVIGVNTLPTPPYLQCCREMEREQAETHGNRRHFFQMLNQNLNFFARGNILDNMIRSLHGAQIRVAEQASRRADVLLRPLACDSRWHDFTHPGKYIALGRRVAEESLDQIKSLVKGRSHENRLAQHKMAVSA